jgi:hypothetical protein
MASVSSQNPAVAFPCGNFKEAVPVSQSMSDDIYFDLAGRFIQSVGEPRLSGGRFSGTFSYSPKAVDQVPFLPNFGRYELSSWSFQFFNSHSQIIGTMESREANRTTPAFLNRQVIAVVRPSCIFLRIDTRLDSCWGKPDWTLRLLFALPHDELVWPTDLTDAKFVSGETRPIRADANIPVPTGERVAVSNATIRLQLGSEHHTNPTVLKTSS